MRWPTRRFLTLAARAFLSAWVSCSVALSRIASSDGAGGDFGSAAAEAAMVPLLS